MYVIKKVYINSSIQLNYIYIYIYSLSVLFYFIKDKIIHFVSLVNISLIL